VVTHAKKRRSCSDMSSLHCWAGWNRCCLAPLMFVILANSDFLHVSVGKYPDFVPWVRWPILDLLMLTPEQSKQPNGFNVAGHNKHEQKKQNKTKQTNKPTIWWLTKWGQGTPKNVGVGLWHTSQSGNYSLFQTKTFHILFHIWPKYRYPTASQTLPGNYSVLWSA